MEGCLGGCFYTASARSCRSPSDPDSSHPSGRVCYYSVVLDGSDQLFLNGNLQNMQFGIPMLCGRAVALKNSNPLRALR